MEDDFDNNYEDAKNTFAAERGAYERTRVGGRAEYSEEEKRLLLRDPRERFLYQLELVMKPLIRSGILGQSDLDKIDTFVQKIPHFQTKNPPTFILGYIASQAGKKITEESLNEAIDLIGKFDSSNNINDVDIIRYGRLFMSYNK
jgi:hypothetical protein